jgi:hypothetical protein
VVVGTGLFFNRKLWPDRTEWSTIADASSLDCAPAAAGHLHAIHVGQTQIEDDYQWRMSEHHVEGGLSR